MRLFFILLLFCCFVVISCSSQNDNPFFSDYNTPFGVPPFEQIKTEHYVPAFTIGMEQEQEEIDAIANNPDPATFENTIVAMEKTGKILKKAQHVFFNILESNTSEELQNIAKAMAPKFSKHRDNINLNEKLFNRIKTVYGKRLGLGLNTEQKTLVEEYYKDFQRGGANLPPDKKDKFRKINEQLSLLSLKFGDNVLGEINRFEMVLEKDDLDGLPESLILSAKEAAKEKGYEGKYLFTIHKPSMIPFLQNSTRRDLKEKIYKAYTNKGNHDDDLDNKAIVLKMANLRIERAHLLGYKSHADYVLEVTMAENPENVYKLLNQLWKPALKRAGAELKELQKMIDTEEKPFKLESWDWWYYAEKLKKAKYDLDENTLKPYFKLENVRQGAFDLANKLYGITFTELTDIPIYHKDVKVFEVKESNGAHIGLLYTDYYVRTSKRGGAWMDAFQSQSRIEGNKYPIIVNVCNFPKPAGDMPSLLSLDNVQTLFHEFGHALHGLLSNCTYPKLAGTSVPRDFVEMPSQIMENWVTEPEMLKLYAHHYETDEPMPDELIKKMQKASLFNQGFATVEYLAASFLDMNWHTLEETTELDVNKFEADFLNSIGLMPEIISRYRSTYFQHIFSGGYSAGYYSYIWSAVSDADAFAAFQENGLFDKKTAASLRENILSAGGKENPMILYKRFRGREPKIDPLLIRRGLK